METAFGNLENLEIGDDFIHKTEENEWIEATLRLVLELNPGLEQ